MSVVTSTTKSHCARRKTRMLNYDLNYRPRIVSLARASERARAHGRTFVRRNVKTIFRDISFLPIILPGESQPPSSRHVAILAIKLTIAVLFAILK